MVNTTSEMDVFFNPKTVAIIGASEKPKFGIGTTIYLLNSKFKTYPVNINSDKIFGHKAYKNVKDIPDDIDLAIVIVSNEYVLQSIKDCIEKKVKGIIIESAGFTETGSAKFTKIQNEIEKIAKESKTRIIGPNCIGVTNFHNEFTTSDMDFEQSIKGNVAVIAQSGVLGNVFIDWANKQGIGFSKAMTIGNKVDVDEVDLLEYLNNDPETKVISLYLEGTKRGKALKEILGKMDKPVLILKNGRSGIGSRAVNSHTGSIAGNDMIYDALFKQYPKIFRVYNFYELFNIAHAFATQPLPRGKNVVIVTGSGSLGALACDEIEKQGLNLADLTIETMEKIRAVIPNWVSVGGTIDLGPSMFETFIPSIKTIFQDKNADCILYIFSVPIVPLQRMATYALEGIKAQFDVLKRAAEESKKPCIIVCFGSRWIFDFVSEAASYSSSNLIIPIMTRINQAIRAFKMMYEYKALLDTTAK
ncbi:MAG: acetate--CoA ligase family protein [Promethearchaeota archaeon]|jgi:acyl-CoA synthetase (NDP forming)